MPYAVKEMFYTLQGEGAQAGRAAVFCRFAGCNLWSGLEADRATAVCQFCDTEFVGTDGINGGKFATADALVAELVRLWGEMEHPRFEPYVVFTGGEPLLQLDETLAMAAVSAGFEVAVETNGTRQVPRGVHWICVSPKAGAALSQIEGSELKLVYPQAGAEPENFTELDFEFFYLQPMDGPNLAENQRLVVDYCLKHPQWRVSLQTHKILAIP
ncbi:MAG: 7-carboxy-7-deazaguanine synthase [Planctomycetota bacterium]|nr:7-carboxy-7-deazaguanine synthase [Planctomycetota bacterium]